MLVKEDGFNHFGLDEMLTNKKMDGLPSDGPGTFFIAKVEDDVLPPKTSKDQEGVFGFGCNLRLALRFVAEPKYSAPDPSGEEGFEEELLEDLKYREKLRTVRSADSGLRPRILRIIGMWQLSEEQIESLKEQTQKDSSGNITRNLGLEKLNGSLHIESGSELGKYALANKDKNIIGDITEHGFYTATLEKDETSLSVGDYVLVQALLMPGLYKWDPIVKIQNLRRDSDTSKHIFGRVGALMSDNVSEEEDRRLLQEFVQNIKKYSDDPRKMEMIVEDLVEKFEAERKKKISSFMLSVRASKDPLSTYKKKREFDETNEPEGEVSGDNKHRFVIQRHKTYKTREHFDLRLENDNGAMSSWAIPKHKLPSGKEKLLAVKTEDHPISYMKFKGKIPEGEYGAGNVEIYDSGTFEEIEWSGSKIVFKLKGKERGTYKVFQTKGDQWMIMEDQDSKKEAGFRLSTRVSC
jgi:bifunctional non-homologous end joining protein LigD